MRLVSFLLLGLCILCIWGCNAKNALLTKEEFATEYLHSLNIKYPNTNFVLNTNLTITSEKNGKDYKHYIDNAYIEYKSEPDSAKEIITRYVASTADIYLEQERISIDDIVPTVKSFESIEELNSLTEKGKAPTVITKKYNSQLVVIYAQDSKNSIRYLTSENFKQLAISEDSLECIALRNLSKILPSVERKGNNGLYMITAGGNYEASLLLLPSLWKKKNFPVNGDFIVAIPNRDMLLITGSKNKSGINKIREIVTESYNAGSYPVSEYLYRWTGKVFEKYN
ncbi:MAG: DUF1444 family protein [Hymenobacter sp.]|nr:MAG: DUF1444 family protein [Hymenobacter sp.]